MNSIKNLILLLCLGSFSLVSCKKSSNSNTPSLSTTILQQGTWKVTLYNDNGTDETSYFTGYSFAFNAGGTITAVKSGASQNGTWLTGIDNSKQKIFINFGTNAPFNKLNNDWQIVSQTSVKVSLQDISGGGGGTSLLTFEKN